MREMDAFEQAYKNGYAAGQRDAVKHGGWVTLTECANEGAYCSVCHKKVYKVWYASCNKVNKVRSDYCPNCGARMDLEEKQL